MTPDITDFFNRGTGSGVAGTCLGVDAIAEFQVLTNTYSARFGGTGSVVNSLANRDEPVSRGGYEFLRNNDLDSRGYFDVDANGQPAGPPPYRRNQFGGSVGGPVQKDKLFFFANYEGLFSSLGQTQIAYVPEPYVLKGELCGINPQTSTPGATTCPAGEPATGRPGCPVDTGGDSRSLSETRCLGPRPRKLRARSGIGQPGHRGKIFLRAHGLFDLLPATPCSDDMWWIG